MYNKSRPTITVQQLIDHLKTFDPTLPVIGLALDERGEFGYDQEMYLGNFYENEFNDNEGDVVGNCLKIFIDPTYDDDWDVADDALEIEDDDE